MINKHFFARALFFPVAVLLFAVIAVPRHAAALTPEEQARIIRQLQDTQEIFRTPPPSLSQFRVIFDRPVTSQRQSVGQSGETVHISWVAQNAAEVRLVVICESSNTGTTEILIDGVDRCGRAGGTSKQIDTDTGGWAGEALIITNATQPLSAVVRNTTGQNVKFGFGFTAINRRGVVGGQTGIFVSPGAVSEESSGAETSVRPAAPAAEEIRQPLLKEVSVNKTMLIPDTAENIARLSWIVEGEAEIGIAYGCIPGRRDGFLYIVRDGSRTERGPLSCNTIHWFDRNTTSQSFFDIEAVNPTTAQIRFAITVFARTSERSRTPPARRATGTDIFVNPTPLPPTTSDSVVEAGGSAGDTRLVRAIRFTNLRLIPGTAQDKTRLSWEVDPEAQISVMYACMKEQEARAYLTLAGANTTQEIRCGFFHRLEGDKQIFRNQGYIDLAGISEINHEVTTQVQVKAEKGNSEPDFLQINLIIAAGAPTETAVTSPETRDNTPLVTNVRSSTSVVTGNGSDSVEIDWKKPENALLSFKYSCPGNRNATYLSFSGSSGQILCDIFHTYPENHISFAATNKTSQNITIDIFIRATTLQRSDTARISLTIQPPTADATAVRMPGRIGQTTLIRSARIIPEGILGTGEDTATIKWDVEAGSAITLGYTRLENAHLTDTDGNRIEPDTPHALPAGTNFVRIKAVSEHTIPQQTSITLIATKDGLSQTARIRLQVIPKPSRNADRSSFSLSKDQVEGNGTDFFEFSWEKPADSFIVAKYFCPTGVPPGKELYFLPDGGGRIACNSPLVLPGTITSLRIAAVNTTGAKQQITTELELRDAAGRRINKKPFTIHVAASLEPAPSPAGGPPTFGPSQTTAVPTPTASRGPIISGLISGLTKLQIAGNGKEITTLSWALPGTGKKMYASYICGERAYLIAAETSLTENIPCNTDVELSGLTGNIKLAGVISGDTRERLEITFILKDGSGNILGTSRPFLLDVLPPTGTDSASRRETINSKLSNSSVVGNAEAGTVLSWNWAQNSPTRDVEARYVCGARAYLIAAKNEEVSSHILCNTDISLSAFRIGETTAGQVTLYAVHSGGDQETLTISLLLKDPSGKIVGSSQQQLTVSPKSVARPSSGTTKSQQIQSGILLPGASITPAGSVPIFSSLSNSSIIGDARGTTTLAWENQPNRRMFASYACPEETEEPAVYLIVSNREGKINRIPCGRDILRPPDESALNLSAVNRTGATVTITISLSQRDPRHPTVILVLETAEHLLRVSPTPASIPIPATMVPLNVRANKVSVAGTGNDVVTIQWTSATTTSITASYECIKDVYLIVLAYLIVPGTGRTEAIPCDTPFPISGNTLQLAGINNSTSTLVSTRITILAKDNVNGLQTVTFVPLSIQPDQNRPQSFLHQTLYALMQFLFR